jgi:hypothetical protein
MSEPRRTVAVVINVTDDKLAAYIKVGWLEVGHTRVGLDYRSHLLEWPWDRACVFPPRDDAEVA